MLLKSITRIPVLLSLQFPEMKKLQLNNLQRHLSMKKIFSLMFILFSLAVNAADVVELKLPKSDLIAIKIMFRNGSISDPSGKEGLTEITANTIADGGTKDLTSTQIKDLIYPWA